MRASLCVSVCVSVCLFVYFCVFIEMVFDSNWRNRVASGCSTYGKKYLSRFLTLSKLANARLKDMHPGTAISSVINKSMCQNSFQRTLDSQHKVSSSAFAERSSDAQNIRYTFEKDALTKREKNLLEKDMNIFNSFSDLVDLRRTRMFTVLKFDDGEIIVTTNKEWKNYAVKNLGRLRYCTNIHDFAIKCGAFAGMLNFDAILCEFEANNGSMNLTNVLLNCFFLFDRDTTETSKKKKPPNRLVPLNRYGSKHLRSMLSQTIFEQTQKNLECAKRSKSADALNENYSRIVMQLPPLIGTNFNGFDLIYENNKITTPKIDQSL